MKEYATEDEALAGLVNRPFLKSQKYQEQQWRANREGADAKIRLFTVKLIRKMAGLGVPMFVHCMVRTYEEQLNEHREGNSKDSPLDGVWPHRRHAADIIHSNRAWGLTDKQWLQVGHVGKQVASDNGIAIVWGGDFKPLNKSGLGWDPAHWELKNWRQMK